MAFQLLFVDVGWMILDCVWTLDQAWLIVETGSCPSIVYIYIHTGKNSEKSCRQLSKYMINDTVNKSWFVSIFNKIEPAVDEPSTEKFWKQLEQTHYSNHVCS